MRAVVGASAAFLMLVAGCAPAHNNASGTAASTTPTPGLTIPPVAAPYRPPAQPPQRSGPLSIEPSPDAHDRLSHVASGNLVDSGGFHNASLDDPDGPMVLDLSAISFTSPSGKIACTGNTGGIVCMAGSSTRPGPPRPIESPPGNWEPYVDFHGPLTYGISAGGPMVPAGSRPLAYGSSIRFGDIECLSARDGITCVHYPSSTGFHLSRDDLTPLKSVDPVPADRRVEPRTPGNPACGALVTESAITAAIPSLPHRGARQWVLSGPNDDYTCNDPELFSAADTSDASDQLPEIAAYVLVFDHGRFVGSATDRPYAGLRGAVDKVDPTLIHLTFAVRRNGKSTEATIGARYTNGVVALLNPIPPGAVAVL